MDRTRRPRRRGLARELIFLPLLAALAALATYLLAPPPPPPPSQPPVPGGEKILPIGLDEALEYHRAGLAFLDLRPPEESAQGRVAGALPLARAGEVPAGRGVVLYGRGGELDALLAAAQDLAAGRQGPIYVFVAGYEGWLAAGGQTEQGGE